MEARRCRCQYQGARIPGHRQRREDAATCLRCSRRTPRRQLLRRTCLRREGPIEQPQGGKAQPQGQARGSWQHNAKTPKYQGAHTHTHRKRGSHGRWRHKGADANAGARGQITALRERDREKPKCQRAHTQSQEEAAMVDGGTKVQMPMSRPAHSRQRREDMEAYLRRSRRTPRRQLLRRTCLGRGSPSEQSQGGKVAMHSPSARVVSSGERRGRRQKSREGGEKRNRKGTARWAGRRLSERQRASEG